MIKMKTLTLDHKGFKVTGTAMVVLWEGGIGEVQMTPFFIEPEKLTHGNIKRAINDGKYGTKNILSARIQIYDVYGLDYTRWNRSIRLNEAQCKPNN